jgi:hypothetical protein
VDRMSSWPSHRAITDVSTPACRSRIAAVCCKTWGVRCFDWRDEHRCSATAACLATRRWMASLLSRRPVRVGNTGSSGRPARSTSQTRSVAVVECESGVRFLTPFPVAAYMRASA